MFMLAFVFVISAHTLHTSYAAVTKNAVENDDVPDPCKDLTYCTIKPKDYPDEKFKNIFKNYKVLPQPAMLVEINNRLGEDDSDCESEVTYEPLYRVRPKRDEPWRLVIQVPEKNYSQRIRIERCTNPGASCFKDLKPYEEYKTYCKQKTNVWELLVAKGDNETETIKAELPVCCSCHYKPVDFMSRFGISKK
ncbi:uncharacterized protein LOC123654948 [Melitaea cinxia]|uniref:uncharacterized protein LOC123654948 n=1 Tax=Melitaea cinxia TaxID=113334 RepID=UPI001E26FA94|nr:uncharacterized protein LOC123654948 [Melitaea cinxia]